MKYKLLVTLLLPVLLFTACGRNVIDVTNEQVEQAIYQSDDFEVYREEFIAPTKILVQRAKCSLAELEEIGGWMKSQKNQFDPIYFTYCGGNKISNRLYLNLDTGKVYK